MAVSLSSKPRLFLMAFSVDNLIRAVKRGVFSLEDLSASLLKACLRAVVTLSSE